MIPQRKSRLRSWRQDWHRVTRGPLPPVVRLPLTAVVLYALLASTFGPVNQTPRPSLPSQKQDRLDAAYTAITRYCTFVEFHYAKLASAKPPKPLLTLMSRLRKRSDAAFRQILDALRDNPYGTTIFVAGERTVWDLYEAASAIRDECFLPAIVATGRRSATRRRTRPQRQR